MYPVHIYIGVNHVFDFKRTTARVPEFRGMNSKKWPLLINPWKGEKFVKTLFQHVRGLLFQVRRGWVCVIPLEFGDGTVTSPRALDCCRLIVTGWKLSSSKRNFPRKFSLGNCYLIGPRKCCSGRVKTNKPLLCVERQRSWSKTKRE